MGVKGVQEVKGVKDECPSTGYSLNEVKILLSLTTLNSLDSLNYFNII